MPRPMLLLQLELAPRLMPMLKAVGLERLQHQHQLQLMLGPMPMLQLKPELKLGLELQPKPRLEPGLEPRQ